LSERELDDVLSMPAAYDDSRARARARRHRHTLGRGRKMVPDASAMARPRTDSRKSRVAFLAVSLFSSAARSVR